VIVEGELVDIKTYALGAGINDGIRRSDVAFEFREIAIRMMVKITSSVVDHACYWLRLETGQWD